MKTQVGPGSILQEKDLMKDRGIFRSKKYLGGLRDTARKSEKQEGEWSPTIVEQKISII